MLRVRFGWLALNAAVAVALCGCSSPPPISVSLSPAAAQAIDQGSQVAISATVTNDSSSKGVTWSLNGPGSLSASGGPSVNYISPPTGVTSVQKVTVIATSVADMTKKASLPITVNPLPAMPIGQTLAHGTVGTAYSAAITLVGGTAPFQWSIYDGPIETGFEVAGALPDGLSLDAATGKISGTPTAAGTWYFEGTAVDADSALATDGFLSITINPEASAAAGNPVPFLNQPLVPTAVAPGSPAFTLNVSGTGFVSGATIDFDGEPLATTFVNSEHLSATLPAKNIGKAKTAAVTAVNPAPRGGASNLVYFQIGAPASTVSFANAPNSPLPVSEPFGLTVSDFDGDGKPDLAIAANVQLYTMLGNGDGTFRAAPGSPARMPSPPYDDFGSPYTGPILVGDFNHSGSPGLAVSELNNEAAVILSGNGDGTFATSSAAFAQAKGQPTTALAAADFNADGELDLAFANQSLGLSPVVLGYGSGAFNTAGSLFAVGFPAGLAVGDFNRDGRLDVAVAGGGSTKYPSSGVAVSLGISKGKFKQADGSPMSLGKNLSAIVAGDFNGDGKLDVAVTDADANTVLVLLGNGDGSFQAPITIAVGKQPQALVVGDFNNDGKLDLAIANFAGNTVTLLLGDGDGTFTETSGSPYATGKGPLAIAAADFNGDGKLDLATGNSTNGTVSILLQQ